MKKIALLLLTILFLPLGALAYDDGDYQYWNTESVSWKVNDQWKLSLDEEFRFGDDATDYYYHYSDIGATYSGLAKWLDLGINYRFQIEEKSKKWKEENNPHLNATLKFVIAELKMSNRTRFGYRIRQDAEDYWQCRNKFNVELPWKFTQLEIQPFIADEVFIHLEEQEMDRNELSGGFSMQLLKNLKAEIFYLWQNNKNRGTWAETNVLGTKLKLSF